jgi:hypothetical protein
MIFKLVRENEYSSKFKKIDGLIYRNENLPPGYSNIYRICLLNI